MFIKFLQFNVKIQEGENGRVTGLCFVCPPSKDSQRQLIIFDDILHKIVERLLTVGPVVVTIRVLLVHDQYETIIVEIVNYILSFASYTS